MIRTPIKPQEGFWTMWSGSMDWRKDRTGSSGGLKMKERDENGHTVFGGPDTLLTLSVWETPQQLEHFVWNTVHKQIYNRKADWFKQMKSHHLVMWWVEEGHKPSLEEAKERLDHLNSKGDSELAFGWSHLPQVKLWQQQRCKPNRKMLQ